MKEEFDEQTLGQVKEEFDERKIGQVKLEFDERPPGQAKEKFDERPLGQAKEEFDDIDNEDFLAFGLEGNSFESSMSVRKRKPERMSRRHEESMSDRWPNLSSSFPAEKSK